MSRWPLWLCLVPAVALAGGQINVDRIEEAFYCEVVVGDPVVGANEGISCNNFIQGDNIGAGIGRNDFVPANRDLLLEDWGLVVLDVLGVTEVCDIDLMTDNTPTGAGSSASRITTNSATNCDEGAALDLDAAGEVCTRAQINQLVQGAGFYRFEWSGAGCTVFTSGALWLRGRFLP